MDPMRVFTFLRVVERGSFTAAAKALGLPKTSVSRQVRELEANVGAQLLRRTTRRISLTEAGTALVQECHAMPAMLAEASARIAQLQGGPRGVLRVTAPTVILTHLVAPRLPEFQERYCEVQLDLISTHRTLDLLESGVDVALRLGPLADTTLVGRRLATLRNRVWASEAYLKRHGEPAHPVELKNHAALVTRVARRGDGHAWTMQCGGEAHNYPVRAIIEADDPDILVPSVLAGSGLMMATDLVMARHAAAGSVRPVLDGWLGRCPQLHALFPNGAVQPPKLRVFVDFLVEIATTLNGEVPDLGGCA